MDSPSYQHEIIHHRLQLLAAHVYSSECEEHTLQLITLIRDVSKVHDAYMRRRLRTRKWNRALSVFIVVLSFSFISIVITCGSNSIQIGICSLMLVLLLIPKQIRVILV